MQRLLDHWSSKSSATFYYVRTYVGTYVLGLVLTTQRVEIIFKCLRFLLCIYTGKLTYYEVKILKQRPLEVIVNFLHTLGPENIFYHVFIEIELIRQL